LVSRVNFVIKLGLTKILSKISHLLGVPEVNQLYNRIDSQIIELKEDIRTDLRFGTLERHLERRTQQQIIDMAAYTQQQISDLHQLLMDAQNAVVDTTKRHTEAVTNEIRSYLETEINQVKRNLDNIRRATTVQTLTEPELVPSATPSSTAIDGALYASLEDRFRGDSSTIYQCQLQYLPYLSGVVSEQFPLIDLGCGRGEWLQLLKDHNVSAKGIDNNNAFVAECTENGLSVSLGELLDALVKAPDESLGAITMFQVLEHLPIEVVVRVLREARRALIPGGVFIGEIPNIETLRVGATTFWIDPTHHRPLFPGVLVFLASTVGFSGLMGKYSSPLAPTPDLTGLPENAIRAILDLHHAVDGPGNFALIATV
jgi:SAM-dependent methyltransferase